MTCIWILLGTTERGWISFLKNENDKKSQLFIYVSAMYFTVTQSTTVGYGDFYSHNSREMTYGIVSEVLAIIIFSSISAIMLSLQYPTTYSDMVSDKLR